MHEHNVLGASEFRVLEIISVVLIRDALANGPVAARELEARAIAAGDAKRFQPLRTAPAPSS
jgi:hypothetical protein